MSLLNDASLVLIPSGYKEDKVYSIIPSDGSGDLDFVRGSEGTRINSLGQVENVCWNLFTYSEDFTNADWNKDSSTINSNVVSAPNGTTTADKLNEDSSTNIHSVYNLFTGSGVNTISVYAKKAERDYICLYSGGGTIGGYFDINNGTTLSTFGGATSSIQNVGNGWYRCSITFTLSTLAYAFIATSNNGSTLSYAGTTGSGVYIWGAQANAGALKPYFPTTDRLNVPRLTYSPTLIERQSTNLVLYSQDFDNAAWTTDGLTVSANSALSPDGTQNADKLISNNGSGNKYIYQIDTVSSGASYTTSAYFKSSEYSYAYFRLGGVTGNPYVIYNLTDQSLVATSGSVTHSIQSIGNGWYRINLIVTSTSTIIAPVFSFLPSTGYTIDANNLPLYTGNGVNGGFIWGAQLETGSLTSYIPTTSTAVTRVASYNSGCPSLLLEKQSTNKALYSEQFDNGAWGNEDITISANSVISPDGTQNADKLIANTNNSDHSIYTSTLSSSSPHTISVYAKAGEYNYIFLGSNNNLATDGAFFNLSNGTISQNTSGLTASIIDAGNGWYRCILSSGSSNWPTIYGIICLSQNGTSFSFAGDNSKGIYTWGFQAEASSYPTSYIPTTSATVTRLADSCSKTGISSLIGQTSGTVFFDFNVDFVSQQTNDPVLWYMKDGGAGERYVELFQNGNLYYVEYNGTTPIAQIYKSGITAGRHKCAVAYANNDMIFYVDGVQAGTVTSGTPNGYSTFGLQYYNSVFYGSQKVNQALIFKRRLTNTELANLTTL